ncbi:MAG: thiamine diphosphokinase [Christensenellaceae bacterium]
MVVLMVGAGKAPTQELFMRHYRRCDYAIAVDGGLNAFYGEVPDLIVGDMDSAKKKLLEQFEQGATEFHFAPAEKDETDAMLALDIAVRKGASKIVFLGALGLRLDHELANLMLLKRAYDREVSLELVDEIQTVELNKGIFTVDGEIGQTVSLLPFESYAIVSAKGLQYPLQQLRLCNDNPQGISNVFTSDTAEIQTEQLLLVIKNNMEGYCDAY